MDPSYTKLRYKCDAYPVNLGASARSLLANAHYWYGLFSHQRATDRWKGIIEVELTQLDDMIALDRLRHAEETRMKE